MQHLGRRAAFGEGFGINDNLILARIEVGRSPVFASLITNLDNPQPLGPIQPAPAKLGNSIVLDLLDSLFNGRASGFQPINNPAIFRLPSNRHLPVHPSFVFAQYF